jgi:uncharacterized damage-inducible protein DinB
VTAGEERLVRGRHEGLVEGTHGDGTRRRSRTSRTDVSSRFQLIIAAMERDLGSTLLHLTRVRLMHDYPAQIAACLEVLADDELWWRPNEHANAVANLVLHLSGSNRYHLAYAIAGREVGRDRDAEFAARGTCSRAEMLETWNDAIRVTDEVLGGLDPARLMDTTDRTGKITTYAQILLHVTHHNAVHLGQIVWITKQRHPGALDDLWMKVRDR